MNVGDHVVQREVNSSIILFDVIAVLIWIIALIRNKRWIALVFSGIGFALYYFIDAIVWMTWMKSRSIESSMNPYLVQLWLQLGPGVIHPSFVCVMLEGTFGPYRQTIRREFWLVLFLGVQFVPALMQQTFQFGSLIQVSRNMNSQRWIFVLIAVLGYLYLISKHVSVPNLWKLFLICVTVESCFELSLFISGIRKATLQTMIVDSLIEFNVGAGLVVALWRLFYSAEEKSRMSFGPEAFLDKREDLNIV